MIEGPPSNHADHAEDFAHRWADRLDEYCVTRMVDLGIPDDRNGERHPTIKDKWRAFVPNERTGGFVYVGITINSGVLNPELLKGHKGGRLWAKARLRDRIDATIAHEWTELESRNHKAALQAAPRTNLPITEGARRILRAMAR